MIVTCSCGIKLKVSDEKITPAGIKIRCPKCGTTHLLKRPVEAAPPVPELSIDTPQAPPAMPWFASSMNIPSSMPLVLIAHDSKAVADMINGVLQEAGMTTDYAPNGLEALKKATELKPRAMIVDVGLTGIYGFELCERLKSHPDTKEIRIILLSSVYGLTAYKRSPVTLYGADDYIEKHHIADQLIPKLSRLLSGEAAPASVPAPESLEMPREEAPPPPPESREEIVPLNMSAPPHRPAPVSRNLDPEIAPVVGDDGKPVMPEIPSVLPQVPVTLGTTSRKSAAPAPMTAPPAPPVEKEPMMTTELPPSKPASPSPQRATVKAEEDASVKLDADFFEHEEYEAPVKASPRVSADPEEIEKARRFARIIVSDIALYSQDAVIEGIRDGTFYDLLKDDVAEGRALYDSRVPEAIRATKDYLQEAFDDFIAAKKKLR
ncbi:MAG: response regulator [Nitrospirota bacterium]|nr:response regulator [Nitrospirota bacterium]